MKIKNSFLKLGLVAGFIAVLGATGNLEKPIYEINEMSHELFHVSAIGSDEEFRMASINKDFDERIKEIENVRPLTKEIKEELLLLKSYIQSVEYKESLRDIEFYESEKFSGLGQVLSAVVNAKVPSAKFQKHMEHEGWDLLETKLYSKEIDKSGNKTIKDEFEFNFNLNYDNFGRLREKGTFGFFSDKKGLASYARAREMAEPFEPLLNEQAKVAEKIKNVKSALSKNDSRNKYSM